MLFCILRYQRPTAGKLQLQFQSTNYNYNYNYNYKLQIYKLTTNH